MLPGVQMALASAPVAYGLIGAGHPSTRVEIGGKIVDIGDMCPTTASSCVPVPTDVLAFKALLNDFRSEQLAKDPCSALFTHNGDTCVERKRESTQVLVMIEGHLQHSCASVDDCTLFSPSSDCTARCEQVVSRTEAQQLKDVIASINTQFCVNYEQDCGPVFIPPCTPPGAPACVNNQCVMQ
jgi:hypothetical protein